LASILPDLRQDLLESSQSLFARLDLFKEIISSIEGWHVSSMGGYYAYVEFPAVYLSNPLLAAEGVGSEEVAGYLAQKLGVVCLPGSFFMPDKNDGVWNDIEKAGGGVLREDRWLR
jgi:aspartate/methionine/tyrosine aminotransferase